MIILKKQKYCNQDLKNSLSYTLSHIYEDFKKLRRSLYLEYEIDAKTFKKICLLYNELIYLKIIKEHLILRLPVNLGRFYLASAKINLDRPRINYARTKKEGRTVYIFNDHTFNKYYYLKWSKGAVKNIQFYRFTTVRKNKRKLASLLKDKNGI